MEDNRYQLVMETLTKIFPDCAVTVVIAPFNAPEGQRTNYVSNANRTDMLVLLKEVVARFEGRGHAPHSTKQ